MTAHEQFADDLALHSLGLLEGSERVALEQHLATCADCREELAQFRGDSALLGLAFSEGELVAPPASAKQRLMDAVRGTSSGSGSESSGTVQTTAPVSLPRIEQSFTPPIAMPQRSEVIAMRPKPIWFGASGWLAAAAMLVLSGLMWMQNSALRRRIETAADQSAQQEIRLTKAEQLVSVLTAPDAVRATLASTKSKPEPQGKAFYRRDGGQLVFVASNMPALPPNKAFELWLIPDNGAPMNAGVFKTDARGNGTLVKTDLPPGVIAKAFAITVENAEGSPVPTSPIMIVGAAGI